MEKVRKPSLKINFIYNISYQILVIILPLITAPYVSRVLGAENIGIYSYTQAFAHYFYLFGMLGVSTYGNRTIARIRDNREGRSKAFFEIFSLQFIMGLLVSLVYLYVILFTERENRNIYIMQLFYVLSSAVDINWLMFGLEKFKLTTIRSMMIRIVMATCVFLFVKSKSDLVVYTFILAFGSFAAPLMVWPFAFRQVKSVRPTLRGIFRHVKPNLTLFWPVIAVSLYNIMDKLILGIYSSSDEVGFYTYAENITQIPNTLILALNNVIMPRMSNLYAAHNETTTKKLMDRVMLFAMLMSVAMAFGLAAVAPVFAPWFYGSEFTRCGLFIIMLCPIIIFKGWAGVLRTQYIIPKGKDSVYIISLSAGAVVNLIINFLLIPRWDGVGAIIGTIAAEFSVCLIQFVLTRKEISQKPYLIDGFVFCAIGVVMYVAVAHVNGIFSSALLTMVVQVIIGVVIYMIPAVFYMVKIKQNPVLVNEALGMLGIKYRFK